MDTRKTIGMIIGISFIFLSVIWKENPDVASYLLFLGGAMICIWSITTIENKEKENANLPKM